VEQIAPPQIRLGRGDYSVHILVAEDEMFIVLLIEETLHGAGHKVTSVTSADDAVRVLASEPGIDLLFTDVDMPGSMDGLELAALVSGRWPEIAIVIASGKRRLRPDEMPKGALFLPKPYGTKDIIGVVESMASLVFPAI
jgi:CheY-like chemotaxis protein